MTDVLGFPIHGVNVLVHKAYGALFFFKDGCVVGILLPDDCVAVRIDNMDPDVTPEQIFISYFRKQYVTEADVTIVNKDDSSYRQGTEKVSTIVKVPTSAVGKRFCVLNAHFDALNGKLDPHWLIHSPSKSGLRTFDCHRILVSWLEAKQKALDVARSTLVQEGAVPWTARMRAP